MQEKYILFDFDGVIVDSYQTAFEVNQLICPSISDTEYRKRFEGNINDWNNDQTKHGANCRHDLDFFELYVPKMKLSVKLVPGMHEVISKLADQYKMIIISSTISAPISELLEKYELRKFFLEVMGNDVHTSKVEKTRMVFSKYNTTKDNCVFVTDTLGDLREANHVGLKSVAVSWGFHNTETLRKGEPFKIIDRVDDLEEVIRSRFDEQ